MDRFESERRVEFPPFTLDLARCELRRDGRLLHVQRKVFDLLCFLIEHRDRVVSAQELLDEVWRGTVVSPVSVRRTATLLRHALADDPDEPRWISTLRGRGYRFVGQLREPGPSVLTVGSESSAPHAQDYRSLIVGRAPEQDVLREALRGAKGGGGELLLLEGEAGIGKSRLLEWCAAEAVLQGVHPIASQCREDEGAPPLWPWIQVTRKLAESLRAPTPGGLQQRVARSLAEVFPELQPFASLSEPLPGDPRVLRFQAYEGMLHLLREMFAERPLVLLFDDLHRSDSSSLGLLEFLAARGSDLRVLFVGSVRPYGGDRAALARLARAPRCRTLALTGLSEDNVHTLLTAAAPESECRALADRIWSQTGGNPFFVQQVLGLADSSGFGAQVQQSIASALPPTIRSAVEQQCAALTPAAFDVLRNAAVFGREFAVTLLAEVLDRSELTTLSALDEATRAHLLQQDPERRLRYRYVHLLVRDVLYEGLGADQRARLHGRIGTALEVRKLGGGSLAAELAHHFSAAGTRVGTEKASRYHSEAGAIAAARFDYTASVSHYRSALDLLDSLPHADSARRCDLQLSLARELMRAGFAEHAGRLWIEAAEQGRAIPDPARLRRAVLELGTAFDSHPYFPHTILAKATLLLQEAIELTDPLDRSTRARLLARLAQMLEHAGRGARADDVAARAFSLVRDVDDSNMLVELLASERARLIGTPEASRRVALAAEILKHAERADDESGLLAHHVALGSDLAALGRFDEWEVCAEAHARLARRLNSPEGNALVHRNRAMRALMLGRFDEARASGQQAIRFADHCEPEVASQLFQVIVATEHEAGGPNPASLDKLRLRTGVSWLTGEIMGLTHMGRVDLVAAKIGPAMDRIRPRSRAENWQAAAAMLVEPILLLKDKKRAEEVLDWLRSFEDLQALSGSGGLYFGPFRRYVGLLHAALGRWREATELLEASLRLMQDFGATPWIARLHLDLAGVHARRPGVNGKGRADSHARAGLQLAEKFGLGLLKRVAQKRFESRGS